MRLISSNVLKPGMVLGRTIWNEAGSPLLKKDVTITEAIIDRLRQLNIQYVYIEDKLSSGIEIIETITPEERKKTVKKIADSFSKIKGLDSKKASLVLDKNSKVIGEIVDDLLSVVVSNEEVLTVLTDAFLYDEYLYQHSFQVTVYSLSIAKELNYSHEDLKVIGIGALLHDVGKLVIPNSILSKPGRLSEEEFEEMKNHARYGFDILRNLHTVSLLVAHCAFQHHERIDGSGYPRGLMDFEIHPYAKIIAVADVFDAVTSDRVYRDKMLPSQGIAVIESGSGTLFDKRVVEAFKRSIVHYPNGTILLLSDGRRGVVVKQNVDNPGLPWVRIFEENSVVLNSTYLMNLAVEVDIHVEKVDTEYIQDVE